MAVVLPEVYKTSAFVYLRFPWSVPKYWFRDVNLKYNENSLNHPTGWLIAHAADGDRRRSIPQMAEGYGSFALVALALVREGPVVLLL
jgi:hypothetical protein